MKRDSLGDRMKKFYEDRSRFYLTRRTPVILRLDGKAFHTFTRGCEKPFDEKLGRCMYEASAELLRQIQGAKLVYTQSDEISILVTDYEALETESWFNYNVQKMCSVAASIAGVHFTQAFRSGLPVTDFKPAYFDCRAFNIPKEEVANYFLWRFKDWRRNSIAMLAQSLYSQKQLNGKNQAQQLEMIEAKGKNWHDVNPTWRNGTFLFKINQGIVTTNNDISETPVREAFIQGFV